MKFHIEVVLAPSEMKQKYPIGSVHTVTDWNAGNPVKRTGKVIGYEDPAPAIYMASYPQVVFETSDK